MVRSYERDTDHASPAPSTAAIKGHPLHPIFIVFPIAFLLGALVTDIVYWLVGTTFWADVSLWLTGAGVVMGGVAAIFGLVDFVTVRRAREHAVGWIHFLGNLTAVILALVSLLIRLGDPAAAVLPWGLVLSAIIGGLLGVTGWAGGELVYRHLVGVTGDPSH